MLKDGLLQRIGHPEPISGSLPATRPSSCRWVPTVSLQGRLSQRAVTGLWQKHVKFDSLDKILSQVSCLR